MTTETIKKISEARYFLNRMASCKDIPEELAFNLSAFVSAARSITLFFQKECSNSPGFIAWYETKQAIMKEDADFRYFQKMRNATIHLETTLATPEKFIEATISFDVVSLRDGISVELIRDGKVVERRESVPSKVSQVRPADVSVKSAHHFKDRPKDDLFDLCELYLGRIQALIREWQSLHSHEKQ